MDRANADFAGRMVAATDPSAEAMTPTIVGRAALRLLATSDTITRDALLDRLRSDTEAARPLEVSWFSHAISLLDNDGGPARAG